ncbi:hypothetical protein HMF8227_02128 [Saliniradius amylolyticus]|uniref:Uncharacterized protein n=1 Tax=Saliniradius amylolyticus TaxID=2183582 RepID=A0A2S2E4K1_9ALTE|nr:Gldg family protein [Saliniradius amylolyticus]AWL12586.1 hypothetical protein HMF8227_02128 [Saliniradius amylolyticus]
MIKNLKAYAVGLLLLLVLITLVMVNNQILDETRLDLTENQVYSLSQGSVEILEQLEEPVHLYYFFSDSASEGMTGLRNYANRVESLLKEYVSASEGKLILHKIDPEPFSEAEDRASRFGLTAASIGPAGEAVYFGLGARNTLDDEAQIPFFDPQQEELLEYQLTKLIYQLSDPEPVQVTLLTDVAINGGQNPMTGQRQPAWTAFEQLQQLYNLTVIGADAKSIPEQTDVLVVLHPQGFSDSLMFSIDQYALAGGRVLAFVDPHHESDPMAAMGGANPSEFGPLLQSWGVSLSDEVVLDGTAGLEIRTATGSQRHLGYLGLGEAEISDEDVITQSLELVNGASFGALTQLEQAQSQWEPLLLSTDNASLLAASEYATTRDVVKLGRAFSPDSEVKTLAARISGKAHSAFDKAPEGMDVDRPLDETDSLNVILVADSDLLNDRFWVSKSQFFGQSIVTPFANNGDLLVNAVENLGGSDALISIRSRGTYSRPFTVVEELTARAEQTFRQQEQRLQQQLQETEQKLAQLQGQQSETGALVLNPEQQQTLDEFTEQRIEIRQQLREVRHKLDKDIEQLGSWLKFINIALAPLCLVLILAGVARLTRRNAKEVLS